MIKPSLLQDTVISEFQAPQTGTFIFSDDNLASKRIITNKHVIRKYVGVFINILRSSLIVVFLTQVYCASKESEIED